jgi:hypothetical protein
MMLYLHNKDLKTTRAINIPELEHTITLANGNWDFTVIGWDGTEAFAGNLICGKTSALLTGEGATVTIDANIANCNDDNFSAPEHRTSGLTHQLNLVSCLTFTSVIGPGSTCNGASRGLAESYRIIFPEFIKDSAGNTQLTSAGLASECIVAVGASNSVTSTNFKIPFGSDSENFMAAIESFSDGACSIGKRIFHFSKGLGSPLPEAGTSLLFPNTPKTDLYLRHELLKLTSAASFGSYVEGSSAVTISYTLKNIASTSATITLIEIPTSQFSLPTTPACSPLAPGASCTIEVRFDPSMAPGSYDGLLNIDYQVDGVNLSMAKPLTATIIGPALTISDTGFDYGDVFMTTESSHNFTITNTGSLPVTDLLVTESSPHFVMLSSDCGTMIAAGSTCNILLSFMPQVSGPLTTTLILDYDDGTGPQTVSNTIQGYGKELAVIILQGVVDFGPVQEGEFSTMPITLFNMSSTDATSISVTAASAEVDFSNGIFPGTLGTCGPTLLAFQTCILDVKFSPLGLGPRNPTLIINYNNGVITQSIPHPLVGEGIPP